MAKPLDPELARYVNGVIAELMPKVASGATVQVGVSELHEFVAAVWEAADDLNYPDALYGDDI